MQTDKKYALLISGGVDSAVACHLLCEQGIKPDLFYIKIGMQGEGTTCTAEEDIELSTLTAKRYGLQLNIVDLQQEYHNRVTAYVVERVKRGLTPNPDVMCNRLIKFGAFEEKAGYAYDYIATGHYAQTYHDADGQLYLAPAPDPVKDQSDFLSQLTDVQAQKLCFPIGHLLKHEVRDIADREHLAPAHRRDSQGICFVPDGDFAGYIERRRGELLPEGDIVDATGAVLGHHQGAIRYTVGQRKGLGVAMLHPVYVTSVDARANTVTLGENADLMASALVADDWIWSAPAAEMRDALDAAGSAGVPVSAKIRYHQPSQTARLSWGDASSLHNGSSTVLRVTFSQPQRAIAPGQAVVVYDGDRVLGGGTALAAFR